MFKAILDITKFQKGMWFDTLNPRGMLPVLPLVVFAQAQTPRYFTNAENVRRIAAGKAFVAFATSGGVRVFTRSTRSWRVYTKNEGLPTHNIHDVVFDAAQPDKLWVLCGSWGDFALDYPEPNLQLVTLDLTTGKVESIAPPTPAPRTARRGYQFFLDYRLSVSDGWAFVFTDKGAALAWDRNSKKWQREITVEPTPARPNFYPGHASEVQRVGVVGNLVVLSIIPQGTKSGSEKPSLWLYDRQVGRFTRHDGLIKTSEVANDPNGEVVMHFSSGPLDFFPDTRPRSLLINVREVEIRRAKEGSAQTSLVQRVLYRLSPTTRAPIEVQREVISPGAPSPKSPVPSSAPPLVFGTDFLVDGDRLWVSGYNDLNRQRSSGIAWLDLTTGKWDGPKPSTTGLPANFVGFFPGTDQVRVEGGGYPTNSAVYNPVSQEFQSATVPRPGQPLPQLTAGTSIIVDPRAKGDPERLFEWAPLQVLGGDEKRALVLGPAEASRRGVREGNTFKSFAVKYDTLFFYDPTTKALTKLEVRGLEGLTPRSAGFGEGALFFFTEELTPGARRGAPIVLRWDTTTGALKRYPESLFRDVSVAEQRNAGARQQNELKRQQRARDERLKRDPNRREPPIDLRPIGEYIFGLEGRFLKAAGFLWLRLDRHLFRYDTARDTWLPEGTADSLVAEGESALWKSVGPDPWRIEFSQGRRLRTEVLRWSPATSWQKLERGDDARPAGFYLAYQNDALWLSGVGVLRIPKEALRFVKP